MKLFGVSDAVAASILRVSDEPSRADDQVFAFCRSPQRFLLDLALRENPIATFKINGEPFASLSSPELIHAVLTGSMEEFGKGLPYDLLGPVFGEGLFNIDGQAWIDRHDDVLPFFSRRRIGPLAGTVVSLPKHSFVAKLIF
jgi:cytochrome P450